jgi:hypothetical protein
MRVVLVATMLVLCASHASAQCDGEHVESWGRCCRPGQVTQNGRCVTPARPPEWQTRGGLIGGGVAMLLGGYLTGVIGGLFGDVFGLWDDVAPVHYCGQYELYAFVPLLHQATLFDGYCYERHYAFGAMQFFALFGTVGEVAGLTMIVIGLIGRRPPARPASASIEPWLGPSIAGLTVAGRF